MASFGGRTRLQLTTPTLVIWLGGSRRRRRRPSCASRRLRRRRRATRRRATRTTAQQAILEATRPLIEYAKLIAPKALSGERVRVTNELGFPVGCLQGHSTAGFGAVRLCTTRDGLLTEVSYKGVKVHALSVKPEITAADLAKPG